MANMDLRPMTLGEVLDRTFQMYKRNFWLFAGIVAIPCLLLVVGSLIPSFASTPAVSTPGAKVPAAALARSFGFAIGDFVLLLFVYLVVFAATQAATVVAVSDLYLGRPAGIAQSYLRIRGRFLTVLLAMVLVMLLVMAAAVLGVVVAGGATVPFVLELEHHSWLWVVAGLFDILVTFTAMALVVCRTALAVPAATLEPTGPGRAISRSFRLTKKYSAQILSVYLLVFFLAIVTSLVLNVPFLAVRGSIFKPHALPFGLRILQGLASWVSNVLVAPIGAIAISLIYYNQRVRKEAFDLEHLMASLEPGETPPAPSVA